MKNMKKIPSLKNNVTCEKLFKQSLCHIRYQWNKNTFEYYIVNKFEKKDFVPSFTTKDSKLKFVSETRLCLVKVFWGV